MQNYRSVCLLIELRYKDLFRQWNDTPALKVWRQKSEKCRCNLYAILYRRKKKKREVSPNVFRIFFEISFSFGASVHQVRRKMYSTVLHRAQLSPLPGTGSTPLLQRKPFVRKIHPGYTRDRPGEPTAKGGSGGIFSIYTRSVDRESIILPFLKPRRKNSSHFSQSDEPASRLFSLSFNICVEREQNGICRLHNKRLVLEESRRT